MRLGVFVGIALGVAVALGAFVSPFASSSPDGLNKVAIDHGFDHTGELHAVQERAPLPAYAVPGVRDERVTKGLAGLAGTVAVFVAGIGLAAALRRRNSVGAAALP